MKDALKNLLKVKSIITILLTGVVCYLAVIRVIDVKEIYVMIIGFYFGTQAKKTEQIEENQDSNLEG